jgi:transcriptional regulator GlxA family with amidase domain
VGMTGSVAADDVRPDLRLAILLLPQFTLSAFSLFLDPVRLASDVNDASRQVRCRWQVMTLNGLPVQSSCGVEISPTAKLCGGVEADWLVVVGGLLRSAAHDDDRVVDLLRSAARRNVRVIGLCTGAFSLAAAGLLEGERCCVSWFHRDEFVAVYDTVAADTASLFHIGERHVTCAGGIGVVHVALRIIRDALGEDVARKSAQILLVPRYWACTVEQPITTPFGGASQKVREALRVMEERVEEPPTMSEVADAVGLSVRQLERLFKGTIGKSPSTAMRDFRLAKARTYLDQTECSVLEVALASGYASPSHFSQAFKRAFGMPPSAYRTSL